MNRFLLNAFEKNRRQPVSREAYGAFAGAVGVVANMLLSALKIAAGLLSGSIAIVADGLNNLSDAGASVVTLAGFRMAQKPADREHPYGHARMEYMAGLFIAVAILLVGLELFRSSVEKIIAPQQTTFTWLSFAILGLSIVVKLWMRSFYRETGSRIGSKTLSVAGDDSRNDVIATGVVLVGALIQHFTGFALDGWLGAAVAVFIFISGILSIKQMMSPLLGEAPPPQMVSDIYKEILRHEGVLGVHDLLVHSYGPGRLFATVHIEMAADADPLYMHGTIDNIERSIGETLGVQLVGHLDPLASPDAESDALNEKVLEIVRSIDASLTVHDLRISRTRNHTNVIFDVGVPSAYKGGTEDLRRWIAAGVLALDERYFPVVQIDRNYTPPGETASG